MEKRYAVVDMETTTTNIEKGKIIQFSCAFLYKGKVEHVFDSYFNPEEKLDESIVELTGIDQKTVNQAPLFEDVAPYIYQLLQDCVFVAHNVNFDFHFLNHAFKKVGLPALTMDAIDTVELSQVLLPTLESYRLSDITKQLGIMHEHPHRADSDAMATAYLLVYLEKIIDRMPKPLLKRFVQFKSAFSLQTGEFIAERYEEIKSRKQYLDEDLTVIAGIVLKKPSLSSPPFSQEKWTVNHAQQEMIDYLHHQIENKEHDVILEAPTGTGKTLGYLLAYEGYFSKEHPLVIATSTVNLQEQLLDTIPYFNRMIHGNHRATLVKSASHYINLDAFYRSLKGEHSKTIRLLQMRLLMWLSQTETGDLSELHLTVQQHPYWQEIRHKGLQYIPKRSPFYKMDYLYRRQESIVESDILILNHALLLQEKEAYKGSYVVIDEAHQLMTSFVEHQWQYYSLQWIQKVRKQLLTPDTLLFSKEDQVQWGRRGIWISRGMDQYALAVKQLKEILSQKEWQEGEYVALSSYLEENEALAKEIITLGQELMEIITQSLPFISKAHNKKIQLQYWQDALMNVRDYIQGVTAALSQDDASLYLAGLYQQQLSIIALPKHQLSITDYQWHQQAQSVLYIGGTLLVQKKADYFMNQLGLKQVPVKQLEEVFDYQRQSHLYVVSDAKENSYYTEKEFSQFIQSIAKCSYKKVMCLFTSTERMQYCAEQLKGQSRPVFYPKANGSNYKIIKQFKESETGILLGTQSFWEGIDLPGEHLECLIIEKLPFVSMNQLFYHAQNFRYQDRPKQLFKEIILPDMILKLRQGLGRLIRTKDDHGTMIVLDRRLLHANYATMIQRALPERLPITEGNRKKVLSILEKS